MEVCGNRAGSEILGPCSGRSSSTSSSALKHEIGSLRYVNSKVPERSPNIKKTMNTSLTVPVMYPWKVPLA